MGTGMYVIRDDGGLVEMSEREYDTEAVLQELLAKYPNLLAGDQMDSARPRRWLLVSREAGIPSEQGGAARWALDHLFLDQDGVPTLVEVKRSTDTRIRREVVGQMLDYAANVVAYWPVEAIRAAFEERCTRDGDEPGGVVAAAIGANTAPDAFWEQVKTNIKAGRVRLVFVADAIPPELQRIVEFLNEQMDPAEVLAIEVKQYVGQGLRTLVPRLIGQTSAAKGIKSAGSGRMTRQWDEPSFFLDLERRRPQPEVAVARRLHAWAQDRGLRLWWGQGWYDGSLYPMLDHNGRGHYSVSLWTTGHVEIEFQNLQNSLPFDEEAMRRALLERLNCIAGVAIQEKSIGGFPNIKMALLVPEESLGQFIATLDWIVDEILSH